MSRHRVVVGAIIVAIMILASARISAAQGAQSQQASKSSREPIRVLADAQESRLVYRVNPVLPEKAREYRISGIVILQVVMNEEGAVTEIRTMSGHPLLDLSARDAVKQGRYLDS